MVRPMEDENPTISAQFEHPDSLRSLLPDLERAIEAAMAVSAGRPTNSSTSATEEGNHTGSSSRGSAVHRVLAQLDVVRGIPFYGYNGDEVLFVKVGPSKQPMTSLRESRRTLAPLPRERAVMFGF